MGNLTPDDTTISYSQQDFTADIFWHYRIGSEIPENKNLSSYILERMNVLDIKLQEKSNSLDNLYPVRPELGEKIGELSIPKLKITLPVYEGTEDNELKRGVGHYADSVLPGENDNSVLSGHRDTVFRNLESLEKGDLLIINTYAGEFFYKIKKFRIVDEDDRTVIVPKPGATLTLTTCSPFDFIGPAPKRYIITAYLFNKNLIE
ncbi:class D sortase [Anaerocolumna cellulosilytica]|nr:class D sortase [Anaerocolumna cellulosilytica]MBB5198088.1 sortase A [Anaerocolumna cellulosilytica]